MKFFCRDISSIRFVIKWGTMKIVVMYNEYVIKINMTICISLMKSKIKRKKMDGNIYSVINYNILIFVSIHFKLI